MHTFAEKPKATQRTTSPKSATSRPAHFEQSRDVYSAPHLQRTIGNQEAQRLSQANTEKFEPSSAATTPTGFSRDVRPIPSHPKTSAKIQTKRTLSVSGDIYEQEADHVADQVMRLPEPQQQHTCACGGGCPRCKNAGQSPGRTLLQTKPQQPDYSTEAAAPPLVDEVLNQAGHPLDALTRNFMEPRFGVDFGQVRLHTDSLAAKSAQAVKARAFTVGNDIVFGAAQYVPGSKASQSLLAHELAHVVQQNQPGARTNEKIPAIQRQPDGSPQGRAPGGGAGAQGANIRREYIRLACQVIAGIREAVEEGRTWYFENEFLLQGDEWIQLQQPTLVAERRASLLQLVQGLDNIIEALDTGALTPTDPASRLALAQLWQARSPLSTQSLAHRWAPVFRYVRLPSGQLEGEYPSLGMYIFSAGSPPRMLQPASFPTWWVSSLCQSQLRRRQPPARREPVTSRELGLSRDTVIFISRTGRVVTGWQWEPRSTSYPVALLTPYEWQSDQETDQVYIVVDGRRVNLLRHGQVEIQR